MISPPDTAKRTILWIVQLIMMMVLSPGSIHDTQQASKDDWGWFHIGSTVPAHGDFEAPVAEVNLKFASSLLELANVPWGHDDNQL